MDDGSGDGGVYMWRHKGWLNITSHIVLDLTVGHKNQKDLLYRIPAIQMIAYIGMLRLMFVCLPHCCALDSTK